MYFSYVFVLIPALKSTPETFQSFHHSHATLPGFTQEKSPDAGSASAITMSDAMRSAGSEASMNTRHGKVRVPSVSAM